MRAGDIVLKSNTNDGVPGQRLLEKKIVDIVAFGSPLGSIRLLVRLNQESMTCELRGTELLRSFLDCFISVAQRYLNLIDADKDGAESHNFAFALLRNSHIAPTTFTNILSSLVNEDHRTDNPMGERTPLRNRQIAEIVGMMETFKKNENISGNEFE